MVEKNIAAVQAYYHALNTKDLVDIEKYLHQNVQLISPFATTVGKDMVLTAIKHFFDLCKSLAVRFLCGDRNQVMVAYDVDCGAIGISRNAALITFENDLISNIELFFDARLFETK